ncbi:four helix bundle protein [filamentous cyanobacterium CCT1]|nr:four helix bundle protein [filamentous cyanobacterium CCT1]
MASRLVQKHTDLWVYQLAFDSAMEIYQLSKRFPVEERYSLTDQIRRSSRSVCANLAEAWRKRRYEAAFIAKLTECEAEAAETQTWIDFAVKCHYLPEDIGIIHRQKYDQILGMLVNLIKNASDWSLPKN